jgi:hypothetical protein
MISAAEYPLGPRESGSAPTAASVALGDPQRIAGTGATPAATTIALPAGQYAVLQVGAGSVRWRLGAAGSVAAGANDVLLPAGSSRRWYVTEATSFVSLRAGDGSSAYEAHVYLDSSPTGA